MAIVLCDGPTSPPSARSNIYLPIISSPDPVAEFSRLLVADPRQQRPSLERCPALQQAAVWRAWGLANGQPWSHIDRDGTWPNKRARLAGCQLPSDYSDDCNYVESLVAGTADPYTAFGALALSPHHKVHLFGENGFFQQQRHFGVAMCAGGEWGWYWCVLIATCEEQSSGE